MRCDQYRWQHKKGQHPLIKPFHTVQTNRATSVGDNPLQSRVLFLHLLELMELSFTHTAIHLAPLVICRIEVPLDS